MTSAPRGCRPFRASPGYALLPTVLLALPCTAGGQWIERPGAGWVDLTVYHHETRRQFGREHDTERIPNGGHAVTTSLFLTAAGGLFRGVDMWVQAPVHRLRYDDFAGERYTLGPGDPRVFLRVGPELVSLPAVPVAIRGGVKWPGGDFDVDVETIPLGEGQRDWEIVLEVGRSFHPAPLWAMGWLGYRWRGPNVEAARDPGNERFWYLAAGGTWGRAGWKAALEGIRGDPWRIQGILIPSTPREITQAFASGDWPIGSGRLGVGLRLPLAGRNLPAGPAAFLQYFLRWGSEE